MSEPADAREPRPRDGDRHRAGRRCGGPGRRPGVGFLPAPGRRPPQVGGVGRGSWAHRRRPGRRRGTYATSRRRSNALRAFSV